MAKANTTDRLKYRARSQRSPTLIIQPPPAVLAARQDVGALGEYLRPELKAMPLHRSWFPIWHTGSSNDVLKEIAGPDTELLAPRGFAKSTWGRIAWAFALGHNPHTTTGWVCYSEKISIKTSRLIKRLIASPRYREVFPWIRPNPKRWADTDWEIDKPYAGVTALENDITFAALGATGSVTSNRFHLIVYDDLIKSKKHILNPEVRQTVLETIQDAIEPCLIPGGRQFDFGTRWHEEDIHATYFTREHGWEVIEQGAIVTDADGVERSAWPERFTLEFLQNVRQKKPATFWFQYQNQIPESTEDKPIKREYLQYGTPPTDLTALTLGVDLAAAESDYDADCYTALVLCAKSGDRYWILHSEQFREVGNMAKIKRIMALRKKWGNFRVVFEKNAYQKSFEGDWRDYVRRYRIDNMVVEGVAAREDKLQRLESVSSIFENRHVWIDKRSQSQLLTEQLLLVPHAGFDLMDACVHALRRLQKKARRPLSGAG